MVLFGHFSLAKRKAVDLQMGCEDIKKKESKRNWNYVGEGED